VGGRQVDVDGAGVADGDHLADPRLPGDRGRQPADRWVVLGLADQPGQLTPEAHVLSGERSQNLGQRPDRRRVLRPAGRIVENRRDVAVGGGALNQPSQLGLARPGVGPGLAALLINSGRGQQACRG
jgi:hypothetical protein